MLDLQNILRFLLSKSDDDLKKYFSENYWNFESFNGANDGKSAERISKILTT